MDWKVGRFESIKSSMLEIIKSEKLICIPNETWGILKYFKSYMLSFTKIQRLKYPIKAHNP
jgi:hypothetical protein